MKCSEKKVFFSRSSAKKAGKEIKIRKKYETLYAYLCDDCGLFHLTSMPRKDYKQMKEYKLKNNKL